MRYKSGVVLVCLLFVLIPCSVLAGLKEGFDAINKADFDTALNVFMPPALKGDYIAQSVLGWMYYNGKGVSQDFEEASKWYRLAADQGDVESQSHIGWMYLQGQGVPQDFGEASKWFRLAANQGDANAQDNLGVLYHNGQGVLQDFKESIKLFRLAANQGYPLAQLHLGIAYDTGQGVPVSKIIAYALYNVSASNDPSGENLDAVTYRTYIAKSMSPKEIKAGQALSKEMIKRGNLLKALDAYAFKKGKGASPNKMKKIIRKK